MGRADSPLRDRMVFVVGAQRSGTTWVQRMLAVHPDVCALPSETHLFGHGMDVLAERVQHGLVTSTKTGSVFMDREEFLDAARAFCDAAFNGVAERLRPGAARVVERSPNHVERLPLIGSIYPDAWVVHVVRDGRDVARSLVSQPWGPTSVRDAATTWAEAIRAAQAAAPELARYREVRYEDLLADPVAGMRELFAWLGLSVGETTDELVRTEASVRYNTDAADPDVATAKWRSAWSAGDLAEFDAVAGELNAALGYPRLPAARRFGRPRALRRVRELAAGARSAPSAPVPPLELWQRRLDELTAAAAAGDSAGVADHLATDVVVRVVDATGDQRAVGTAARGLLDRAVASGWGTPIRSDLHVAGRSFTLVLRHRTADGDLADRTVVARFAGDDLIEALTVYRYPLS